MKNINTPRTLADCSFTVGHQLIEHTHHRRESPAERIAGVLLATALGVIGAAALVHWWSLA
jgi:hypothetical protein